MALAYECHTCGVLSSDYRALCMPVVVDDRCVFGRGREQVEREMCHLARAACSSTCEVCGRPSLEDDIICMPSSARR